MYINTCQFTSVLTLWRLAVKRNTVKASKVEKNETVKWFNNTGVKLPLFSENLVFCGEIPIRVGKIPETISKEV